MADCQLGKVHTLRIHQRCIGAEKERLGNNLPDDSLVDQIILVVNLSFDELIIFSTTELSTLVHFSYPY